MEDESRPGRYDSIYLGHWRNNQRSGLGVDIEGYHNVVDSGNWRSGVRSGPGRLRYGRYRYIDSSWIDGKNDGSGREVYSNAVFEGKFKDLRMNGLGKKRFLNESGQLHIGEHSEGELHGLGKSVFRDGQVNDGVFIEGKFCRPDQVNDQYVGAMKDDKPHGNGRKVLSDGSIQQGKFDEGLFESDLYSGGNVQGKKNGRGKLVKADGSILDGLWFDDKLVKVCHEPDIKVVSSVAANEIKKDKVTMVKACNMQNIAIALLR
jgi:hypothetical protein